MTRKPIRAVLTSFQHQVALHRIQAEGLDPAAHHGVPHHALVAVDVHQAVVTRDLERQIKKIKNIGY